jgi:hypothetical protein
VQLCCLLADLGLESGIVSIKKLVLDSSYKGFEATASPLDLAA